MSAAKPTRAGSLDRAAGAIIALLIALSGLVIFAGSRVGVRVQGQSLSQVGPLGPLVFQFSVPMDADLVEALFRVEPSVSGKYEWPDDRTLRFIPDAPFAPDVSYQAIISPGATGKYGEMLRKEYDRSFTVRQPQIAFLTFTDQKSQFMLVDMDGGHARQLFQFDGLISEFNVSRDGERILFSAFNDRTGIDIWQVDRDGRQLRLILNCDAARCSGPAISPDGTLLAYTREGQGIAPGAPLGAPRIWILDLESGEDRPLFEDSQILGYGTMWSPDGQWVSSYDGLQDIYRVVSLKTGEQVILNSVLGSNLSWSADSTRVLFTDLQISTDGMEIRTLVNEADFRTGEISNLIGASDGYDYGYGALAWSPVEDKFILGLRPLPDDPSNNLWLVDPEILAGPMIASEPHMSYDMPSWDIWGRAVLFQQFTLNANYKPQIAMWSPDLQSPRLIAEGTSARWLP